MKDYLTWWRKIEVEFSSSYLLAKMDWKTYFPPVWEVDDDLENESNITDNADWDCLCEQLYAIREGLADEPGPVREG